MKYLIDHRYKIINSLNVYANDLLDIYQRGRSEEVQPKIEQIRPLKPALEAMITEPFDKEAQKQVSFLVSLTNNLVHLPENLEQVVQTIKDTCTHLLSMIEPFSFSTEDSIGYRRAKIVELAKEAQLYLNMALLDEEGKAASIIDEKQMLLEVMNDIERIKKDDFTKKEQSILRDLHTSHTTYREDSSLKNIQFFYSICVDVETLFRNEPDKKGK